MSISVTSEDLAVAPPASRFSDLGNRVRQGFGDLRQRNRERYQNYRDRVQEEGGIPNLWLWILLGIIGLVLLGLLIWCLVARSNDKSSTTTDDRSGDCGGCGQCGQCQTIPRGCGENGCPCAILPPVVRCCELSCPSSGYAISWGAAEGATSYDLAITATDRVTGDTETYNHTTSGTSYIFYPDETVFTGQLDLEISVTARNIQCLVNSDTTTITKAGVSSRPGGWQHSSTTCCDDPLATLPIVAGDTPLQFPLANSMYHHFSGPADVPYNVELLTEFADVGNPACSIVIQEISTADFAAGNYANVQTLATIPTTVTEGVEVLTATVAPTLSDSIWYYSNGCNNAAVFNIVSTTIGEIA